MITPWRTPTNHHHTGNYPITLGSTVRSITICERGDWHDIDVISIVDEGGFTIAWYHRSDIETLSALHVAGFALDVAERDASDRLSDPRWAVTLPLRCQIHRARVEVARRAPLVIHEPNPVTLMIFDHKPVQRP